MTTVTPEALALLPIWSVYGANKAPRNFRSGDLAKVNDPQTWGTRAQCLEAGYDRSGLMLGPLPDGSGLTLCGIDLDSAFDGHTFTPEAREVIEAFASHTCFSQSGTGAHVFILAREADLVRLASETGKKRAWQFQRGSHQEMSLFGGHKFFAYTGRETNAGGTNPELLALIGGQHLRLVDYATLREFVTVTGPRYAASGKTESGNTSDDRSALVLGLAMKFKRAGKSREQFEVAAESDTGLIGQKWAEMTPRQRQRDWVRADQGREPFNLETAFATDAIASAAEAQPLGDTANAFHFASEMRGRLIWVPEQKAWLEFQGGVWSRTDPVRIIQEHAAAKALKAREAAVGSNDSNAALRDKEATRLWRSHAMQTTALEAAQPMLTIHQADLDTDSHILGVENGTLDLRTGQLFEADRTHYVTKRAGTAFVSDANAPLWDAFLTTVMPKVEARKFLQRATGYTLVGVPDEEVWFFAHGPGASGKSTFAAVLDSLFGEYAAALHKDLLVTTKHNSEMERQVVALQGKRLASVNETARNDLFDDAKIKRIVSREKIPARRLYGEAYDFSPTHTVWIRGNYKPGVLDGSDAMWRRLVPIHFGVQIPEAERQPDLHTRIIREELPGVLNWALQGALDWQRMGLAIPAAIEAERAEYRRSTDFFGQWLADAVEEMPIYSELHSALYQDWCQWCADQGQSPGTTNSFSRELSARGFQPIANRHKGRRWQGIRLHGGIGLV